MRAQAKTLFVWLGCVVYAMAASENSDEKFQKGAYLEALRAYQTENLAAIAKAEKTSPSQAMADSPTWEVDSQKEQMALCLFEKGLRGWLGGKPKEATEAWIDSQKQILAEGPQAKRYYRRTQLAVLRTMWDDFSSDGERLDALVKTAVIIQDLPLPERTWDLSGQINVEQQILAIAEYEKLIPKVADAGFLSALFQKQLEIHHNRQLARFLTRIPPNNELTYDALEDRVLFEAFAKTLWDFFDQYLQSPTGGGAYVEANRDNFRLVRVLMSLDAADPAIFDKNLKFWLENMVTPNPQVVSGVLLGLQQIAMDSTDADYSRRIFKTVVPYFGRVTWPDDTFRVKLSRALRDAGQYSAAAKLLESTLARTGDKDLRLERLSMLVDMKLKAADYTGAYETGQQALAILGDKIPPNLNRAMASACINLKRYTEAANFYQKVMAANPEGEECAEVEYLIGWAYTLDKKFDLARPVFSNVVKTYPDSSYARKAEDYLKALPKPRGP